jgi:hypothetical protein
MSRELIGYFGVLESTAEVLQDELKHADQLSVLTSGFPLFPLERVELLDEFRIKDLSSPKQKFHKFYKPVEGK